MAAKQDTSKARPARNRRASNPRTASPLGLEALEDIIEEERLRLMKAHSVLACVINSMEVEEIGTGNSPYYPDLIEVAGDLVNESIRRLDSVNLRTNAALLERAGDEEEDEHEKTRALRPRGSTEAREPRMEYLVAVTRRQESPTLAGLVSPEPPNPTAH